MKGVAGGDGLAVSTGGKRGSLLLCKGEAIPRGMKRAKLRGSSNSNRIGPLEVNGPIEVEVDNQANKESKRVIVGAAAIEGRDFGVDRHEGPGAKGKADMMEEGFEQALGDITASCSRDRTGGLVVGVKRQSWVG